MTEIWVDAQLSPALAAWINRSYDDVRARSVRSLGLREAEDEDIFRAARKADAIVMSKDSDFLNLLGKIRTTTETYLGNLWQYFKPKNA